MSKQVIYFKDETSPQLLSSGLKQGFSQIYIVGKVA